MEVEVIEVKTSPFLLELLANGKVEAVRKADLRFAMDGIIRPFVLQEGQQIHAGEVLAMLDDRVILAQQEQAELDMQRAQLDYEDHLLRLGYSLVDAANLDPEVKRIAYLRSGWDTADQGVKRVAQQLENILLIAPFSGKIANLQAKAHNLSSSFDFFCTLIDDDVLQVTFKILEQELLFVRTSQEIVFRVFGQVDRDIAGRISAINPTVDTHGFVSVTAVITHRLEGTGLLDGMGVQVLVRNRTEPLLVVPKGAILERQGRKVVFTEKDGFAYWNYVEILHENQHHYALRSGVEEGDKVIVQGHFNLSHEHPVKIK